MNHRHPIDHEQMMRDYNEWLETLTFGQLGEELFKVRFLAQMRRNKREEMIKKINSSMEELTRL